MISNQFSLFSRKLEPKKLESRVQTPEDSLLSAKLWIAEKLQESKQFSIIDLEPKFRNRKLDLYRARNIYAEKSPDEKYLVVVSQEPFPNAELIMDKAIEAYRNELAIMFVQVKCDKFGEWDGGLNNEARARYKQIERKRHTKTTEHERKLNKMTSSNVVYFRPKEKRLEVVGYSGGLVADYRYKIGIPVQSREYITIMKRDVLVAFSLFTLRRLTKGALLQAEPATYNNLSHIASLLALEAALVQSGCTRSVSDAMLKSDRDSVHLSVYDISNLVEDTSRALDSCDTETLAKLTKMFGKTAIGDYARE